jgi:hypothetical protein
VRTLRLLIWLRWRIGINTTTTRGRWAAAGITTLFALAMAPIYVGGAIGSFAIGARMGAAALPIVFGICQLAVMWISLLIGAMGRTFELDKLKRYPLRPRDVFAVNTLASLGEPFVLMTVPALVAVALGVAKHSGAGAGWAATVGAILLLLVTASLLQLLLALIDDLLRREWMRYVAAFFFTMTVIGFQLAVGRSSSRMAERVRQAGYTLDQLMDQARHALERLPTVGAPASVAGAAPVGWLHSPLAGLAVSLLLILVPILLGARVMARAALRGAVGGRVRTRASGAARGSFGSRLPGLTRAQSLLFAREILYMTRTPALLYQLAVVPLTAVALIFISPARNAAFGEFMPMFVLIGTLAGRNLMLWGYDGPGIRTLFLLPVPARDLVLSKNLGWLASALVEAAVVLGALTAVRTTKVLPHLALVATGWLAIALTGGVLGTWISARFPTRPPERGLARRSPGGAAGVGALLGMFAVAAALILAVVAARSLAPEPMRETASLVVTSLAVCAAACVWWVGLERNADALEQNRERMIDVLAKTPDA